MGSAVAAGALPLADALAIKDVNGVDVESALKAQIAKLPVLEKRPLGMSGFAYIEAHIEQGPVLENQACDVGIVTGIQGLHAYEIQLLGAEAHAGTTPLRHRKDALVAATTLIGRIRAAIDDPADILRFTVGRLEVYPGSPNTVPGRVTFNIDLRHPDPDSLLRAGETILQLCSGEIEAARCRRRFC